MVLCHEVLVGGFNPLEKYARQIGSFPQGSGVKKNIFELPPPRVSLTDLVVIAMAHRTDSIKKKQPNHRGHKKLRICESIFGGWKSIKKKYTLMVV